MSISVGIKLDNLDCWKKEYHCVLSHLVQITSKCTLFYDTVLKNLLDFYGLKKLA